MTHNDREYHDIADLFNRVVKASGSDGIKYIDSRAEVIRIVKEEARYLLDDLQLEDAAITAELNTIRTSASRRAQALFDSIAEAVLNESLWGDMDPVLDTALRTGALEGFDKTLRYWTVQDWLDKLSASASNVARAIEADQALRESVNLIIQVMAARGAATVEDLMKPIA